MSDLIRVTGTGKARAAADLARFSVAVSAVRASLDEASDAAATTMTRVRAALAEAGIEGPDARTSSLTLGPHWRPDGEPRAYSARQRLAVTAGDVGTVGTLIAALVAAGGDEVEVGELSFEVRHPHQLDMGARDAAWTDARARAEHYAHLAGRRLGAVRQIVEGAAVDASPRIMAAAMRGPAPTEIEPGDVEAEATVTVAWELA